LLKRKIVDQDTPLFPNVAIGKISEKKKTDSVAPIDIDSIIKFFFASGLNFSSKFFTFLLNLLQNI